MAQRGRPANRENKTTVKTEEKATPIVVKNEKPKLDLNMLVPCANGTHGKLIYISKRQLGYEIIWDEFGQIEYIELQELLSMRNSAKKFFTHNWLLIDDIEVLKFLGVEKFYENALNLDNFDDIFKMKPEDVYIKVSKMTDGMKRSVAYRAKELIETGELDSRKVIEKLEAAVGFDLIERY